MHTLCTVNYFPLLTAIIVISLLITNHMAKFYFTVNPHLASFIHVLYQCILLFYTCMFALPPQKLSTPICIIHYFEIYKIHSFDLLVIIETNDVERMTRGVDNVGISLWTSMCLMSPNHLITLLRQNKSRHRCVYRQLL